MPYGCRFLYLAQTLMRHLSGGGVRHPAQKCLTLGRVRYGDRSAASGVAYLLACPGLLQTERMRQHKKSHLNVDCEDSTVLDPMLLVPAVSCFKHAVPPDDGSTNKSGNIDTEHLAQVFRRKSLFKIGV